LWDATVEELLGRTSSKDPTVGGGAIAAVTAAFGVALIRMAIEVTTAGATGAEASREPLLDAARRACDLQAGMVETADRDAREFSALMAAWQMPRDTDRERVARESAIGNATVVATGGPLSLAESSVIAIGLGIEIEPHIKATIVSDVQAGRDLLHGAALAALRTADINLAALETSGHAEASGLRRRRDAALQALDARGRLR
jgi:formiminotetrahydrofolate cyclodeaminase